MTDEQINAAIAEACGWENVGRYPKSRNVWVGKHAGRLQEVPDYCTDLNAMAEAEKVLDSDELFKGYYLALYDITQSTRWPICATAKQRAEAFLRTLGKWEGDV
jgi:hypothetical protein